MIPLFGAILFLCYLLWCSHFHILTLKANLRLKVVGVIIFLAISHYSNFLLFSRILEGNHCEHNQKIEARIKTEQWTSLHESLHVLKCPPRDDRLWY